MPTRQTLADEIKKRKKIKQMRNESTEKIHNTADTSREAFIHLTNTGRLIDQKKVVYETIQRLGPITSRKLAIVTGHERTSVTRSLYDLLAEIQPCIKVAFTAPCEVTGRRVKYYSVINWQRPGAKLVQLRML